ncbi:hypothetical protein M8J77_014480 [Diaphorina citri]|nr:hypothetical protein M8J77_014480 [Diaphorina citri]
MFNLMQEFRKEDSSSEEEEESEDLIQRRREEVERKARRGEMDPRLEFTFQLLMQGTGLLRNEILDHVFADNMLDDINLLFLPHQKNKLIWYYQDVLEPVESLVAPVDPNKPSTSTKSSKLAGPPTQFVKKRKLFLTDGYSIPLRDVAMYMIRLNTNRMLPEEGFNKDLFCGIIRADVGLVLSIQRIMETVFMESLVHYVPDPEEEDVSNFCEVKNLLLPGLRSFCSALRVCEEVCEQKNLFEDDMTILTQVPSPLEAREIAERQEDVLILEDRLKMWIKRVTEVLSESEQLRKESDCCGPQDELEYWKKRGAKFSQIVTHLREKEVQMTIQCLTLAKSKIIPVWKETDMKITYCFNEARDNAKYIQAMEHYCHSLYIDDPERMCQSILNLLQTVRLIHSVSKYYNTSERISSLMVKITSQMIETLKLYITCRGLIEETVSTEV